YIAKEYPDYKFAVVGSHGDGYEQLAGEAKKLEAPVDFPGKVSDEELIRYYQRAQLYIQPSAHEGFGVSIAEAMACGCVPIGTERAAIPEVIGDCGFYVPFDDPIALARTVSSVLKRDDLSQLAIRARDRILKNFTVEKKRARLIMVIGELVG
ncbi:glycosyltransferase family 4 protein, partial [bacterium]|nr:glycosyltransferase family 4 protein [bacterium]